MTITDTTAPSFTRGQPAGRRRGRLLAAMLLLALGSPVSAADILNWILGKDPGRPIWTGGPHQFVKTVKQDRFEDYARPAENQHPADVAADQLARVLASLRLAGNGNGGSLFDAETVLRIAPPLSEGLSRCTKREDVVFGVVHGTGGRAESTTSGRIFVAEGKLNLILGQVRAPLPVKRDRPGRRKEPVDENVRVAGGPGISHRRQQRSIRSDWVEIDVAAAAAAYQGPELAVPAPAPPTAGRAATTVPAAAARAPNADPAALDEENRRLREELARLRRAAAVEGARPSPPADLDPNSMENRLARLKALHEKALITDEDYQLKRREILEEL